MMGLWPQSMLAFFLEMASLSLLNNSSDSSQLAAYFALHALASALVAALGWVLLPMHLKNPRWAVLALLFSFDFFIPGLGVVSMLIALHVATRFPSIVRTERYVEIAEPVFQASEKEKRESSDVRAGFARRILNDPRQSVDTKLRVLIALQSMRPKVAIPLLQSLLADPSEDIRLLAYSMMDAWEKDITQRLQAAQIQLEQLQSRTGTSHAEEKKLTLQSIHRKLAELYWEQVDSGLARGDLRTFALQRAKSHCEQALQGDAKQSGIWLVYSTVQIELGQSQEAHRSLLKARSAGVPDSVICPLLAKLAFDAQDYDHVQTWMRRAARSGHLSSVTRQSLQYWTPLFRNAPPCRISHERPQPRPQHCRTQRR